MFTTVFEVAVVLCPLRLSPSTSFHIVTDCEGNVDGDYTTLVLPQNISQALPSIRYTRCLSLTVGQRATHLSGFRGSLGDTFEDGPDWSITMPDLTYRPDSMVSPPLELGAEFYYLPRIQRPAIYYAHPPPRRPLPPRRAPAPLRPRPACHAQMGALLRTYVPLAHARDWGRRPRRGRHTGLPREPRPVPRAAGRRALRDHRFGAGERGSWLLFFRDVVQSWARIRAGAGKGLRSLTVRTRIPPDLEDGSGTHTGSAGGSDDDEGRLVEPGAEAELELGGFTARLRRDLAACLGDFVGKVVVVAEDCPACGMEYEIPPYSPESNHANMVPAPCEDDEGSSGEDDEGSSDEDDPYFY